MKPVAILVRFVGLLAVLEGTAYAIMAVSGDDGGANIGAGLIAFAAVLAVAAIWGFVDGRSAPLVPDVLGRWAIVAILVGAASVVVMALGESDGGLEVILSDLLNVSTFVAVVIGVPAIIGAALGAAVTRPSDNGPTS